MAYATQADIAAEFKNLTFGANKGLTDTEVTELIAQEEATINAIIANRYEVPITGTEALKVMKGISIAFVAYRVAKILNLKKNIPIPKEMIPQELDEGSMFRVAQKRLKAIQSGKIILNDAVVRSSTQGIKSYNAENNICPLWERDTNQW